MDLEGVCTTQTPIQPRPPTPFMVDFVQTALNKSVDLLNITKSGV